MMNLDFKLDQLPVRKAGRRAGLAAPSSQPNLAALPQLPAACCPVIWTGLQSVRASLTICPLVTRSPLVPGSSLFLCWGLHCPLLPPTRRQPPGFQGGLQQVLGPRGPGMPTNSQHTSAPILHVQNRARNPRADAQVTGTRSPSSAHSCCDHQHLHRQPTQLGDEPM